jgi:hypothetical protein
MALLLDWKLSQEEWEKRIKIFDRDQVSGRYCAFVDILGFGAATESDLPSVLRMYEVLLDNVDVNQR